MLQNRTLARIRAGGSMPSSRGTRGRLRSGRKARPLCSADSRRRDCSSPEFAVDDYVLGLFTYAHGHSFAEAGANDGFNSQ